MLETILFRERSVVRSARSVQDAGGRGSNILDPTTGFEAEVATESRRASLTKPQRVSRPIAHCQVSCCLEILLSVD